MKQYIIKGTLATALLMSVTFACKDKFLDVPATGQLTSSQLTSSAGLDGLLLSAYAELNGRGYDQSASDLDWLRGSISGGEANKGSNSGDFNALTPFETYTPLNATNAEVNIRWRALYEGISRANMVLRMIPSAASDVTDANGGYKPVNNRNFQKRLNANGVRTDRTRFGYVVYIRKTNVF